MKKINTLFVALASVMLATSCAEDIESAGTLSSAKISVHPSMGNLTRATETTTANLQEFKTYSFITDDPKNYMDDVTYKNNAGEWGTDAGTFYWPVEGDLNFYSYAPATPGSEGTVDITSAAQKLSGFVPYATAAEQQDFIYSKATGNLANNGTSGLDINFSHALSEITVAAKNSNTAYSVEVTGVKVGNVISKGDFTFPSLAGDDATWTLGTDKATYTTEWDNANTLSADASTLDISNTAFMLIPQQLEANDKAIEGNYLALKVKITMQGGQVVHDGWAYIAIPTLWEMGYHYNYTVDFSSGAGQDENGNPIISGTGVKFNVTVTPWDEEGYNVPSYIFGKNSDAEAFTIKMNETDVPVTMSGDGTWKYDLVGKKITSLEGAFAASSGDSKIEYLNLAGLNTSEVTSMKYMFNKCPRLKTLDVSSLNTKNVTNMRAMFQLCSSLKSLDVSKWNTTNVTDMTGIFNDCTSLTSLDVSKWNTSNVTNMRGMFQDCNLLTPLDVSKWNTSNVTDMAYMFNECSSLTLLDVSKWNTDNVTSMRAMFQGCSSINHLDVLNFDTHNVTDMAYMFKVCSSLTLLDVSKWNTSNVTDMAYMFCECSKLTSLDVSNFKTSKVTNMKFMFSECYLLTTLNLSSFNTENVTNMSCMLQACNSLEFLDLSNFDMHNVIDTHNMFWGCKNLKFLDLSGWNTANVTNMAGMFKGCNSLKTIYMVGCDNETVNKIKQALTAAGLSTDIVKTTRE